MAKTSEIDALFAQPKKAAIPASAPAQMTQKRKAAEVVPQINSKADNSSTTTPSSTKHSNRTAKRPVTVVQDTSTPQTTKLPPPTKRKKTAALKTTTPAATMLPSDVAEFTDSRGTTRRKTDDGLTIYSESELKLGQGGDTPLCPFDCDCCKSTCQPLESKNVEY